MVKAPVKGNRDFVGSRLEGYLKIYAGTFDHGSNELAVVSPKGEQAAASMYEGLATYFDQLP